MDVGGFFFAEEAVRTIATRDPHAGRLRLVLRPQTVRIHGPRQRELLQEVDFNSSDHVDAVPTRADAASSVILNLTFS